MKSRSISTAAYPVRRNHWMPTPNAFSTSSAIAVRPWDSRSAGSPQAASAMATSAASAMNGLHPVPLVVAVEAQLKAPASNVQNVCFWLHHRKRVPCRSWPRTSCLRKTVGDGPTRSGRNSRPKSMNVTESRRLHRSENRPPCLQILSPRSYCRDSSIRAVGL